VCMYMCVVCQLAHGRSDGVRHRSMEQLGRSAVGTPPDFTPGFIKSSPSGSRRPQRLDRSGSSMKKGEPSSAGVAGRHKVIQVSLQQDVKLHTSENAWKPVLVKKDLADDDESTATEVADCDTATDVVVVAVVVVAVAVAAAAAAHSH